MDPDVQLLFKSKGIGPKDDPDARAVARCWSGADDHRLVRLARSSS